MIVTLANPVTVALTAAIAMVDGWLVLFLFVFLRDRLGRNPGGDLRVDLRRLTDWPPKAAQRCLATVLQRTVSWRSSWICLVAGLIVTREILVWFLVAISVKPGP